MALKSIESALYAFPQMHLMVIFNGANHEGEDAIAHLSLSFPNRISSFSFAENSSLPEKVWQQIDLNALGWIHMPGDDDLVVQDAYRHFENEIDKNKDLVAVSFSAIQIDHNNQRTGKVLHSAFSSRKTLAENLAIAIHEPPFVWPSLMFNVRAIPTKRFNSRFAFDWWVGINLLLSGNVIKVEKALVQYRVHPNQESNQVPEFRKRFEAKLMIESFLSEPRVHAVLSNEAFKSELIEALCQKPPIYGDTFMGGSIMMMLVNSSNNPSIVGAFMNSIYPSRFAASHGLYFRIDEFPHFNSARSNQSPKLNFNCLLDPDLCPNLRKRLLRLLDSTDKELGLVTCKHSKVLSNGENYSLAVDCHPDNISSDVLLVNQLLKLVNTNVRYSPSQSLSLAHWERRLLEFSRHILRRVRKFKSFLP
jgi:hypothetical protein